MRSGRRAERGFVLVAVLGALAVLAIVAAALSSRVDSARSQLQRMEDEVRQRQALHDGLAQALYWVSSRPPGVAGWGTWPDRIVIADAREYDSGSGAYVALQDHRGLLSLNIIERPLLIDLLLSSGVPSARVDAMIDVLEDYIDTDDLKRLNGAEAADYAAVGLPPPRNDWMISTVELRDMPLWRDEVRRVPALLSLVSSRRSAGLNPNTAPIDLLKGVMPGVAPEAFAAFERLRRQQPFESEEMAQRATGLPFEKIGATTIVGNQVAVRLRAQGSTQVHEYNVLLTPTRQDSPWVITEHHVLASSAPSNAASVPARDSPLPELLRRPGQQAAPAR